MTVATGVSFLFLFSQLLTSSFAFTALETDNHPCKAENMKWSKRYTCDSHGNIICQAGWREPETRDSLNDLNPCLEPICDDNGTGCLHGECRAPNYCACEVGWEGTYCDKCLTLPGCVHGSCNNAFDCNCEEGWTGAYCDIAECDFCINGECVAPGECVCNDGWMGENCTECQPMPGCVHGKCGLHPHTCVCLPGWEGHLCDQPICNPPCVHGYCRTITHPNQTIENFCMCDNGWRAPGCDKCRPYWHCPNQDFLACNHPNECFCNGSESDPDSLCNNTLLQNNNNNNGEKVLNLNKLHIFSVPVADAFDAGQIIIN